VKGKAAFSAFMEAYAHSLALIGECGRISVSAIQAQVEKTFFQSTLA
jgi:hypothetical protein